MDRAIQVEISATPESEKLSLRITSPEDLIILKYGTGREKDIDDTDELMHVLGDKLDEEYVLTTLRHLGWDV